MLAVLACALLAFSTVGAQTVPSEGTTRLVSSSGATGGSSGRLEIFYNGQWGTICDDGFLTTEANVACRERGFLSAISYGRADAQVGYTIAPTSQPIWLDNVDCSTSNTAIRFCSSRGIGVHDCTHSEDVVIFCSGLTQFYVNIIIGCAIAGFVLFVIIPVIICIVICVCVCGCAGAAGAAARRGNRYPSQAQVVAQPQPTTAYVTTTTTSDQQPAYPMEEKSTAPPPYPATNTGYPPAAYPPQPQPTGY